MTKGQEALAKVLLKYADPLQEGAITSEEFICLVCRDMAGRRVYFPKPKKRRWW